MRSTAMSDNNTPPPPAAPPAVPAVDPADFAAMQQRVVELAATLAAVQAASRSNNAAADAPKDKAGVVPVVLKETVTFDAKMGNPNAFVQQLKELSTVSEVTLDKLFRAALTLNKFGPVATPHIRQVLNLDGGMLDLSEVTAMQIQDAFLKGGFGLHASPVRKMGALYKDWPGIVLRTDGMLVAQAFHAFAQRLAELPAEAHQQLPPIVAPENDANDSQHAMLSLALIALFLSGFPPDVHTMLRCNDKSEEFASWHAFRTHALANSAAIDQAITQAKAQRAERIANKRPTAVAALAPNAAGTGPGSKRQKPSVGGSGGGGSAPDGSNSRPGPPPGALMAPADGPVPNAATHNKAAGWRWKLVGLSDAEADQRQTAKTCLLCGKAGHLMDGCPSKEGLFRSGKLLYWQAAKKKN